MKKSVIASLAAVAFAAPAIAADMPVKAVRLAPAAVYNWTGFYVGGNIGYGFGKGDTDVGFVPAAFDATPFSVRTDPKGFVGGAQAGYNWQNSALVLGVEADISYANLRGDGVSAPVIAQSNGLPIVDSFHQAHQETNWLGTARLRLGGTPVDRLLVYATGGLAFGDVKSSAVTSFGGGAVVYAGSASDTKVGWTIGGGIEWALMGNWTAKAEYLYYDLGSQTVTAIPQPLFPQNFHVISTFETKANIARFGINYKFGNPIIADR
jgi:outer membrane immunogenic protein